MTAPIAGSHEKDPDIAGMTGNTHAILDQIRALGYGVSLHRMGEYVEAHARHLEREDEPLHLAGVGFGDDQEERYRCAYELARMVGMEVIDTPASMAV
jgi:hypothetical protein